MKNGKNILKNGTIKYYKNNRLHNLLGPAVIYPDGRFEYWENGQKFKQLKNSRLVLIPEPAKDLLVSGSNKILKPIKKIVYTNKKGQIHRDNDKPAMICYYQNEKLYEYFYQNGKLHRETSSAYSLYYKKNQIEKEYFLEGNPYNYEEWQEKVRINKIKNILKK